MNTTIAILLRLAVLPHPQEPQQVAQVTMEVRPGIPASAGELTTEVQRRLTRGNELTAQRRYAEAQAEFRAAATVARRQGHLPSRSLWHLACAYYYQGDNLGAVNALDELRRDAARFGDLRVEALALFNAAWLDGQAGRYTKAQSRVKELQQLLSSPYMPVAIRDHLTTRLNTQGEIAVGP
jgi:tetratricopeptide (TPR) repeat protein